MVRLWYSSDCGCCLVPACCDWQNYLAVPTFMIVKYIDTVSVGMRKTCPAVLVAGCFAVTVQWSSHTKPNDGAQSVMMNAKTDEESRLCCQATHFLPVCILQVTHFLPVCYAQAVGNHRKISGLLQTRKPWLSLS